MKELDTPLLILIFNRPDKIKLLIERLRLFKPKYLYISGDGPRQEKVSENKLCLEAQEVTTTIDWPCEIHTNFSKENLGCKRSVSKGINWFFQNVEAGIILEDDCLPDESFFSFCTTLLEIYKNDERVMHINGTSFAPSIGSPKETYYFSRIPHSWGWATWRRAWKKFDPDMERLDELEDILIKEKTFLNKKYSRFWIKHLRHIKKYKVDSWANSWVYTILYHQGVCITPFTNLIENIGFDTNATNTLSRPKFATNSKIMQNKIFPVDTIEVNKNLDAIVTDLVFRHNFIERISFRIRKWYHVALSTIQIK